MNSISDGPATPLFSPIPTPGGQTIAELKELALSSELKENLAHAPEGNCVGRGLPFLINNIHVALSDEILIKVDPFTAKWIVFMHTSDHIPLDENKSGFFSPMPGAGRLNELAAEYVLVFDDGSESSFEIRRRHQIGAFQRRWGENCLQAVTHTKPAPGRAHHEQTTGGWGHSQTRVTSRDMSAWVNWLWACENPTPEKQIVGIRIVPKSGAVLLFGVTGGSTEQNPLAWESRKKALVTLRDFDPEIDEKGLFSQVQIDLGQVISATPQTLYPDSDWAEGYNNQLPERSTDRVIVEYTAHPDARMHVRGAGASPLRSGGSSAVSEIASSTKRVRIHVHEKGSSLPVPVKLHVHGQAGEYLAPVDRHRIPNPAWFEDYSTDFVHQPASGAVGPTGLPQTSHYCTYIPGETEIDLPIGKVYLEVSKGYEIRPTRMIADIDSETNTVEIEIERVLKWRDQGWVSADTHVHFLSPVTAMLEGSAEGVNVVNLLASQWGELMTNVGDFDGSSTWGSKESGGDGEYLVRVGTENRQHVMGHISLLGYEGNIIAPMTTGGPDESALGDPVGALLTEWARQCKEQNGVVIIPHFPNPRAENAAVIVDGGADGVEMTSWGDHYSGISPYSLSDWYRYLSCGYPVAAVGGTDKMSASTAVGTVRTYAKLAPGEQFTYDAWRQAIRRMETFVTYGPLLEFFVDGNPAGSWIDISQSGGTVDVSWQVSSVTVPVSQVDLVVNGEIVESTSVGAPGTEASGSWSIPLKRSSWLALLVRGKYADKPEMIAAHSSAVFARIEGSEFYAEADALTILEQIEGAMAFLDTVGTRAETAAYKRMRMVLESAHRKIHNRMHEMGHFHEHTTTEDHPEHH